MKWFLKRFCDLTQPELYGILQLRNAVFIVEQACPYPDIDGHDIDSYHLFLEDNQNKICACCRILDKGQTFPEASIGRFVVRKDKRNGGLARQMLQKAITFIDQQMDEHVIKIEAQAYLKNFYMEMGFTPCSDRFLDDGIPHIEMIRRA